MLTAEEAAARSEARRKAEIEEAFTTHLVDISEAIEKAISIGNNKVNFSLGTISDRVRRALQEELEKHGYLVTYRPGGHSGPSSWSISW